MYMSVNERVSEIGLRKAVGARSKDILFQFIAEVSATSLVGGTIGIGLGLAAFGIVRMHMQIPFNLPVVVIAGIILLPILVGIVAGIIPARKASKYNPVDALRS
jgi:putative ABC transport system permease protein